MSRIVDKLEIVNLLTNFIENWCRLWYSFIFGHIGDSDSTHHVYNHENTVLVSVLSGGD